MLTAIFDIGKTNKKFFLFDECFKVQGSESIIIEEVNDEDGHPSDNLLKIVTWMKSCLKSAFDQYGEKVGALNFSSYGASLVHLDANGEVFTPLYNYTKEYPLALSEAFYSTYGGKQVLTVETGSPADAMLNSGLQLYWIKKAKPELFQRLHTSLHLPQYLSYIFTRQLTSDYTSIGCHTHLWNYKNNHYHSWVDQEGISDKLAPIVSCSSFDHTVKVSIQGQEVNVGSGIHDSSAALLPYLACEKDPFVLISTGTWCVSLNPFDSNLLTASDIDNGCLNYMTMDGKRVKATRVFLGHKYKQQIRQLADFYAKPVDYDQSVQFNLNIYKQLLLHQIESSNYEVAYHKVMMELLDLQIQSTEKAIGDSKIKKLYIDGGFANNDIFVSLISDHFRHLKVYTTQSPMGSAIGAAMAVQSKKSPKTVAPSFLTNTYHAQYCAPIF